MLTKKQHELLIFINNRLSETGVSPSFDEMKEALDLRSKSGIHRLITALEERGFIRRLPHRARALEVLKMPDGAKVDATPSPEQRGFKPAVVNADFNRGRAGREPSRSAPHEGVVDLPVLGRIAAGTPIEAIQHEVDRFSAPEAFIGKGDHYILEVQGESMIDAGIQDGDFVVIKRCESAENGSIVVALVDDEEATLKRLRKKGASIALEAANPAFETRIYGPDRVSVQGKLVGLMRRYH
ncbi:transcriptional repressor LexA [Hyphococcus flavus]|uniref:LexA repressor n=1 Tax=Hyphococcus flavus TaxID=1866326 RepID=A0AAE9ZBK9_9PROT|nr:transcriptional repressor LexA [Hyphococcus flavus]WDI31096.1 transcriptional repressor LexA [Hyphococcus flavus]